MRAHRKQKITRDQVVTGVSFESDWSRKWCSIFGKSQRRKAKPKELRITFDTQLKIALTITVCLFVLCDLNYTTLCSFLSSYRSRLHSFILCLALLSVRLINCLFQETVLYSKYACPSGSSSTGLGLGAIATMR